MAALVPSGLAHSPPCRDLSRERSTLSMQALDAALHACCPGLPRSALPAAECSGVAHQDSGRGVWRCLDVCWPGWFAGFSFFIHSLENVTRAPVNPLSPPQELQHPQPASPLVLPPPLPLLGRRTRGVTVGSLCWTFPCVSLPTVASCCGSPALQPAPRMDSRPLSWWARPQPSCPSLLPGARRVPLPSLCTVGAKTHPLNPQPARPARSSTGMTRALHPPTGVGRAAQAPGWGPRAAGWPEPGAWAGAGVGSRTCEGQPGRLTPVP